MKILKLWGFLAAGSAILCTTYSHGINIYPSPLSLSPRGHSVAAHARYRLSGLLSGSGRQNGPLISVVRPGWDMRVVLKNTLGSRQVGVGAMGGEELPLAAKDWTIDHVSQWLWSYGAKDSIIQILFEQGIDGTQLLHLSDQKMIQMGIKRGERNSLRKAVSSLKGMKEVSGWTETEVIVWARGVGLPDSIIDILRRECVDGDTLLSYDIEAMATDGMNCKERMLLYQKICDLRAIDSKQARDLILSLFKKTPQRNKNQESKSQRPQPTDTQSRPKTSSDFIAQPNAKSDINASSKSRDSSLGLSLSDGDSQDSRNQGSWRGGEPKGKASSKSKDNIHDMWDTEMDLKDREARSRRRSGKTRSARKTPTAKKSASKTAPSTSAESPKKQPRTRPRRQQRETAASKPVRKEPTPEETAAKAKARAMARGTGKAFVRPVLTIPVSGVLTPGAARTLRLAGSQLEMLKAALDSPDRTFAYIVADGGPGDERVEILPDLSTLVTIESITHLDPPSDKPPPTKGAWTPKGGGLMSKAFGRAFVGGEGGALVKVRASEGVRVREVVGEDSGTYLMVIGDRIRDKGSEKSLPELIESL
uniref:SAM domain-containing protein n=1 Tax=Amorphochlora amoebiformis TaxID=1561963 RepID=A0A7S0D1M2_9EUKA|mmetsp:Transcript_17631/g.28087  ORF Transcript_17631/g.28087 Transcript_17631/m.28087 type:complete len:591 (+) Transcript_17631:155-1927(+)